MELHLHIKSHCTTPVHHTTPHAPHRNTTHQIIAHHITPYRVTSDHTTTYRSTPHHYSHPITSHRIIQHCLQKDQQYFASINSTINQTKLKVLNTYQKKLLKHVIYLSFSRKVASMTQRLVGALVLKCCSKNRPASNINSCQRRDYLHDH